MNNLSDVRGYSTYPLSGSPAGRLHDHTTTMLASGLLPRCPHPDQPSFWYLPAGMLTCATCLAGYLDDESADACHVCGEPASAIAAWVTGGVPCMAGLCEPCHASGLVPLATN